jgi:isochorismate hydrolase
VWLADGRSVYDALGAGFTLLALPGVDVSPAAAAVTTAAAEHDIPVTVLALTGDDTELSTAQLRERWGADLLLIRPDQHVAWRGSAPAAAATGLLRAAGW